MRKNYLISLLALSAMAVSTSTMAKENVTVSGSTTVLPVMQKISEHLMQKDPSVVIELSGGGSGSGIKALNEQLTQIAMSSRKIKDKEVKAAGEKGVKPFEIQVAVDAIVPIVNPKNSLNSLSLDDLRKIYKGEIKNWKEVGGSDAPIVLVSRDSSSGTFESWESLVMKNSASARGHCSKVPTEPLFRPYPRILTPSDTSVSATSFRPSRPLNSTE